MLKNMYVGLVFVNGQHFTHPNRMMGAAAETRNKVLRELRHNVLDTFTEGYIKRNKIEFRVKNPYTGKMETVKFW